MNFNRLWKRQIGNFLGLDLIGRKAPQINFALGFHKLAGGDGSEGGAV